MTLDLTGKRCPVIFSAVLFFVFEKFSSTSTGGKSALRWFYCLEKQKLSLERTPPGKKLRFCIRYLWKMKEKPANLNRGLCFSIKWKATCRNWAHLEKEKQFGLKSHLRACCTQPFNLFHRLCMGQLFGFLWLNHGRAVGSILCENDRIGEFLLGYCMLSLREHPVFAALVSPAEEEEEEERSDDRKYVCSRRLLYAPTLHCFLMASNRDLIFKTSL